MHTPRNQYFFYWCHFSFGKTILPIFVNMVVKYITLLSNALSEAIKKLKNFTYKYVIRVKHRY